MGSSLQYVPALFAITDLLSALQTLYRTHMHHALQPRFASQSYRKM